MYKRFHERFGTAGVVLGVIALIAALGGTAFAAGAKLNGTQKKEVKAIAKSFAGKPGAPGAAGTNGTNGTNGKDGAQGLPGQKGDDGADGKSVAVEEIETGEPECEQRGGAEVKVEDAGSGVEVCNGEAGSPWAAGGTLPSGSTETGAWALGPAVEAPAFEFYLPISFPIALAADIPAANVHVNPVDYEGAAGSDCPGKSTNPKAKSGHLCIYAAAISGGGAGGEVNSVFKAGTAANDAGASTAGAVLYILALPEATLKGTWAVTG